MTPFTLGSSDVSTTFALVDRTDSEHIPSGTDKFERLKEKRSVDGTFIGAGRSGMPGEASATRRWDIEEF